MPDFKSDLSVIGAGSYGTALAIVAASKGLNVLLWDHRPDRAAKMEKARENAQYLPGLAFPSSLTVTSDLSCAVKASRDLLVVVPSVVFAQVTTEIARFIAPEQRFAWATKGLNPDGRLLSEVARQELPYPVPLAVLSGPTFARELASGMPTAISVAGDPQSFASEMCERMHNSTFRLYEGSDLIGLQLGGAIKNVIAIAAGMSDGLGYGANARTALITRGLAEMVRFGLAAGASERSFMGLSGLGDLILTCTDNQSRNRRFGVMLGQGVEAGEALKRIGQVVEGYQMTRVLKKLSGDRGVQMPICSELYEVIFNGKDGKAAAMSLLGRALKAE